MCLPAADDDRHGFGVTEVVWVRGLRADQHPEPIRHRPARRAEAVAIAPLPVGLRAWSCERAPPAAVVRLQVKNLAGRRYWLRAELAPEQNALAVANALGRD